MSKARKTSAAAIACSLLTGTMLARADVVTDWNEIALTAIKAEKTPPPKAARALAILHASIFDSVNGITQSHERYLVPGRPAGTASPDAAALSAAHFALLRLFPAQQAVVDAAYQRALVATPNSSEKNAGIHWGEWVANIIVGSRLSDGSESTIHHTPSGAPGEWAPTPPQNAPGLLPEWQQVTCFAMTSGSQFRPVMPPGITTSNYAFDFNLTKQLGAKNSTARTPEQTQIALFWADGPGSVTPPGHWNQIARDVALQLGTTMEENARLFALLNIAAADAAILCWDCKYFVKYWRPITAIQNADTDNNPATEKDAAWIPLLDTPPFPEYTSGHSSFSSAAATVLAAFFASDNVVFTTGSEAMPGFLRKYHTFSEAAAEAGMSRIYGGIHFMSANQQGLASGAKLGTYVVENFLKPRAILASRTSAPPRPRSVDVSLPAIPISGASTSGPLTSAIPEPAPPITVSSLPPPPAGPAAPEERSMNVIRIVRPKPDAPPTDLLLQKEVAPTTPIQPAPATPVPASPPIPPRPEGVSNLPPPLPPFPAPIPPAALDRTAPTENPVRLDESGGSR